jgi:hypothetical protein
MIKPEPPGWPTLGLPLLPDSVVQFCKTGSGSTTESKPRHPDFSTCRTLDPLPTATTVAGGVPVPLDISACVNYNIVALTSDSSRLPVFPPCSKETGIPNSRGAALRTLLGNPLLYRFAVRRGGCQILNIAKAIMAVKRRESGFEGFIKALQKGAERR